MFPKAPSMGICLTHVYKGKERSPNLRRWQQAMLMLASLQLLRSDEPQALLFFPLKKLSDENSELLNACQPRFV